jgi:hypothetical protein
VCLAFLRADAPAVGIGGRVSLFPQSGSNSGLSRGGGSSVDALSAVDTVGRVVRGEGYRVRVRPGIMGIF